MKLKTLLNYFDYLCDPVLKRQITIIDYRELNDFDLL